MTHIAASALESHRRLGDTHPCMSLLIAAA
jgi:hypothetical protein